MYSGIDFSTSDICSCHRGLENADVEKCFLELFGSE